MAKQRFTIVVINTSNHLNISRMLPHYPQRAEAQICGLSMGHWFYQEYDRLARTPLHEEIGTARPPVGLIGPPELELHVAIHNLMNMNDENNNGVNQEVEDNDDDHHEDSTRQGVIVSSIGHIHYGSWDTC